jgi:hypothetical protein
MWRLPGLTVPHENLFLSPGAGIAAAVPHASVSCNDHDLGVFLASKCLRAPATHAGGI